MASINLGILKYSARKLQEMPVPDLSPEELHGVLQWQMIPTSATQIYEYAFLSQQFRRQLNQLNPEDLDAKTKRLVISTLRKIGTGQPEGVRWGELVSGLAGACSVYLYYYFTTSSTLGLVGSCMSLMVSINSMSKVRGAKDRHELTLGHRQEKAFQDAFWDSVKSVFYSEFCTRAILFVWRLVKLHPWWSLAALPFLLFVLGLLLDPVMRLFWLDIQLSFHFCSAVLSSRIRVGMQHASDAILDCPQIVMDALFSNFIVESIVQRIHGEQQRSQQHTEMGDAFIYPEGFDYNQNVRLLCIKRRTLFTDLECELMEVDLESASLPRYNAISHVWSHGPRNRTISLNGKPFQVTSSVYSILSKSSSHFVSRIIWIDNICINQDDDAEKASQIQKMRDIYYNASLVQIHLVDHPSASLAVPFLFQLLSSYGASKESCSSTMVHMLLRKKTDQWLRTQIDSLLQLLSNQWFERAWVIQEFVTAREVEVIYGSFSFDWAKFTLLAQMIQDEDVPEISQCLMSGGNISGAQLKTWVKRPVRLDRWKGKLLSDRLDDVHSLLSAFQSCKATQWQDKIFALIGFSDAADRLSHVIDYKLPKDQILLAVARYLSGSEDLFKTFAYAGLSLLPTHPTTLPTWVADWTISRDIDPIVPGHNQKYDACKSAYGMVYNGKSKNEIILHGVLFDTIKKISDADLDFTPDAGTLQSNPRLIDTVLKYFSSAMKLAQEECTEPYRPLGSYGTSLDEAVSRTMIGDATWLNRPILWKFQNLVSRFLDHGQFIKEALEQGKFTFDDIYPLPSGYGAYEKEPEREEQVRQLMKDIENARWLCGGKDTRRKFGITDKGCMGLLPRKTAVGDVVCILNGAAVPVILRKMPSCDAYQLVGEAYVHGIMEGEGVEHGEKMKFHIR